MDVDEKKGALRLANHVDRGRSLGRVQGRALVAEFYESEFVAPVAGTSHRIERFTGNVPAIWSVGGAGSQENHKGHGEQYTGANRIRILHLIEE
jgi:hypothetical protein